MRIARRLLALLAITVVIALVAVVGLSAVITGRALPQTSGTIRIDGLHAPVSVIRDQAGIAQIYADDPHDLFLAQGYVHAQDRLWQMEFWRHISSGRLAELFGPSELATDRFIRTLGWRAAAERDLGALPAETRDALGAYAEGVNAYLADHRANLGLPFVVAGLKAGTGGLGGYGPEPWTPLDSIAWQKVQAFNLGGNYADEIFRLLADAKLGDPALTDQLSPPYAADMPVVVPSTGAGTTAAGGRPRGRARRPRGARPRVRARRPRVRTPPARAARRTRRPTSPPGASSSGSASTPSPWPASTRRPVSSARTGLARTTGSSHRRRARPGAPCSPMTRTWGSACPRSGT